MNAPRFAKLAGAFLARDEEESARASDVPLDVNASMRARARAISAIEQAIRDRARKKTRVRWMIGATAIAASVIGIVATKSLSHHASSTLASSAPVAPSVSVALGHATGNVSVIAPDSQIQNNGQKGANSLADGNPIAAGSRIVARDGGHAVLALSSGTRIAVDDGGDVSVVEEDAVQIFSLASGTMRADVAKLLPGQRFVIRTGDAEVEVHGTSFSVTVVPADKIDSACGGGTSTRVVVYEGVVTVRHAGEEARVPKGESWPQSCSPVDNGEGDLRASSNVLELPNDQPQISPNNASENASENGSENTKAGARGSAHTNHRSPKSSSPLAEQNDIFESGLTAERDGLTNGAISDFERYLALYPNGPLAEHAAVRRMNLLRTVDHGRAAVAAREYLAKYPSGFARSDAQRIVSEKP